MQRSDRAQANPSPFKGEGGGEGEGKHFQNDPRELAQPNRKKKQDFGEARTRTFFLFIIRLIIVYGILIAPWPGLKRGYASFFRVSNNALLWITELSSYASLDAPPQEHPDWDTLMTMHNPQTSASWRMEFPSRGWGYLPNATVLSLGLALPRRRKSRVGPIVTSLILVQIFVAFRVAVAIWYGMYYGGVIHLSEKFGKCAEILLLGFADSPVTAYIVPVLIWLLVSFSKQDWEAAFASRSESRSPAGS